MRDTDILHRLPERLSSLEAKRKRAEHLGNLLLCRIAPLPSVAQGKASRRRPQRSRQDEPSQKGAGKEHAQRDREHPHEQHEAARRRKLEALCQIPFSIAPQRMLLEPSRTVCAFESLCRMENPPPDGCLELGRCRHEGSRPCKRCRAQAEQEDIHASTSLSERSPSAIARSTKDGSWTKVQLRACRSNDMHSARATVPSGARST